MTFWVEGALVAAEVAFVPVLDRSFLYGDGLFETVRVRQGRVFRWDQHWRRLTTSAALAGIRLPGDAAQVEAAAAAVSAANGFGDGVLRLHFSRGVGPRGYSPRGAGPSRMVISAHPPPKVAGPRRLATASLRVASGDPMGRLKSASQLSRVLALAEVEDRGADEALLLTHDGMMVEAASASLLWVKGRTLATPPLALGGLPGITREALIETAPVVGWTAKEVSAGTDALAGADAVLLASSGVGVAVAASLDGRALSVGPAARFWIDLFEGLCARESQPLRG